MASIVVEEPKDDQDDKSLVCVPLANLSEDGTNPEEGDEVNFDITGTIERVDGDEAYVRISEVNGEPISQTAPEEGGPKDMEGGESSEDEEGNALKKAFMAANGA